MSNRSPRRALQAVTVLAFLLATAGVAGARDLPRQATTAPATDRCAALGTGFRQVAGSDTCIRLSGSVEVSASVATGHGGTSSAGTWMGRDARR